MKSDRHCMQNHDVEVIGVFGVWHDGRRWTFGGSHRTIILDSLLRVWMTSGATPAGFGISAAIDLQIGDRIEGYQLIGQLAEKPTCARLSGVGPDEILAMIR